MIVSRAVPTKMSTAPTGSMLESLGKYRIVRKVGDGAAGSVYLAEDTLLNRSVALKVLNLGGPAERSAVDRFILEARSAARLDHPNTVRVYEIDERDGRHYIAMEWLPGGSAQNAVDERGPIPWREATQWIIDACRGLQAAHEAGMLHRDVKPANLLRTEDNRVKIGDFGLVKILGPSTPMLTALGSPIGTPSFMSPEQCQGESLDVRSDVYSLGATYFALLTGRPPFESETSFGVMFAHCANPVPDPQRHSPEIPSACSDVIRRAMSKAPTERYATVAEMLEALEALTREAGGSAVTRPPSPKIAAIPESTPPAGPATAPPKLRSLRAKAGWIAAAIALGAVGLGLAELRRPKSKPPDVADAPDSATPAVPSPDASEPAGVANPNPFKEQAGPTPPLAERTFKSIRILGENEGAVTDLEFSSTGRGIATGSAAGHAAIWIVDSPKPKYRDYPNPLQGRPIHAVAYSGERRRLVTPAGVDKLALWDSTAGRIVDTAVHSHKTVRAIEFSPDGRVLATGGDVGLHLWEVSDDDKLVHRGALAADEPMVTALSFSRVVDWLGATAWNGSQLIYSWRDSQPVRQWLYPPNQYTALAFGNDRLEWVWTAKGGRVAPATLTRRIPPFDLQFELDFAPLNCDFAFGRRLIAFVGDDRRGDVYFLDLESQTMSRIPTGLQSSLNVVRFSPIEDRIAVGSANGDVLTAELPLEMLPPRVSKSESALDRAATLIPDRYQIRDRLGPILEPLQRPSGP